MSPLIVLAESSLVAPNPGLAIWTLVTFTIVALVLRWKVWGPLMHAVEAREKAIQDSVDAARREREQAEKILAEQQAIIAQSRKESAELVRKSQAEVEKAKEELFAKARTEADALLVQARKQIVEEKRKAIAEIREVAVDLALAAANKLVATRLDDASQRALAEDFIATLQKSDVGGRLGAA